MCSDVIFRLKSVSAGCDYIMAAACVFNFKRVNSKNTADKVMQNISIYDSSRN